MDAKRPKAEANLISQMLRVLPAEERFPVDVEKVVKELCQTRYSDEPIVSIKPFDIDGVEGLLCRHATAKKWKIGYNSRIQSAGRVRFTLAHEFGHYILHRQARTDFQCSTRDMHEWDERSIEAEADTFASYLLMPLDDFRAQVANHVPSIEMLRHCSSRYGVSLMAAALKWTEIAAKRVVVLAVRDGFVLWARSNQAAFKSGLYLPSRKTTIQVPEASVLHRATPSTGAMTAALNARLWFKNEPLGTEVIEHACAMEGNYPYTLGMLVFPAALRPWELPDDELLMPVDRFFSTR